MCDKAVYRTVRATPFLLNKLNCPNLGQVDKRNGWFRAIHQRYFLELDKKIGQNKTLKKNRQKLLGQKLPGQKS